MITPAEMGIKLNLLETEFWKVFEAKDVALVLNWVIHSLEFAEKLVEISHSGKRDIEYTEYEENELRAAYIALKASRMHLTTALTERFRKEDKKS